MALDGDADEDQVRRAGLVRVDAEAPLGEGERAAGEGLGADEVAALELDLGQVGERRGEVGVVRAELALVDGERPLEQLGGLVEATALAGDRREVGERGGDDGVVGAAGANAGLEVGAQELLAAVDGFLDKVAAGLL